MEADSAEGPGQESPAEAAARQRKAEMAAARRAAILAQMSAQQKSFIKEHAKLFQETGSSISGFLPLSLLVFSLTFSYFREWWHPDSFESRFSSKWICHGLVWNSFQRSNLPRLPRPGLHSGSLNVRNQLHVYRLPGRTSPDGRAACHGVGIFRPVVDRFEVEEWQSGDGRAAARDLANADWRWQADRNSYINVWPRHALSVLAATFWLPSWSRT